MTTPASPKDPTPAGDDRNLVAVDEAVLAPSFEEQLHGFWTKNGKIVIGLCVVIFIGIIAKGAWEYIEAQKEKGIQEEYASATTPEKLKAFVSAHPGHMLSGVTQVRLADEAYAAGKTAEALAGYESAKSTLKTGPLAARAQLGFAMAKIQAGKTSEGETALKALAGDATQLKGVRAEAYYQLASLASESSKADDVKKFTDQLMQLDPSSPWMQRAMMLRAKLPAEATPATLPTMQLPSVKP